MSTMAVNATPKSVMVDPNYNNRKNRKRIEEDEKELEELLKSTQGDQEEETEEKEQDAEVTETEADADTDNSDAGEGDLSSEEKTFKKRYGDLRRYLSQKEKEWEEKFEKLDNKTTQGIAPPKSDEDLEAWAKKYPDVAGIVESIASKKAKEMFDKTQSRFQELDDLTYETKRTKAETAIREVHSDFDKLKSSDDFHDWADEQPKWIKDALYDNEDDAKAVIRVIDLYKADKGLTPTAKKARAKDAAAYVKTKSSTTKLDADGSSKRIRESDVMKMSDAEFEKNLDKITEAQRTGNFIYDVSKK